MNWTFATRDYGAWLLAAASLIGLIYAIYQYFDVNTGVGYSAGAELVVVSSALIFVASLVVIFFPRPDWLRILLVVLLFLGLIGTAVAAYFLESYALLGLMIIGMIGWLIHVLSRPPFRRTTLVNEEAAS